MFSFFKKFKTGLKSIALAAGVFLAVYSGLYFFTSWDTKPVFEKSSEAPQSFAGSVVPDDKTLAAQWGISLADYNIWAAQNGINIKSSKLASDPDGDGLSNHLEYLHGTNPNQADTDGDGFTDKREITNGYDPAAPGDAQPAIEIAISKIGVNAPMVWSASDSEKDQLADLAKGVAHFPSSASPGQTGNMIVSGHSSNYIWAKGSFNYIFKNLNNLMPGDIVDVKTIQQNGKVFVYHYKIIEKFTALPDDDRIFDDTNNATLTLSTCWPLRTNLRRLIVKGELI